MARRHARAGGPRIAGSGIALKIRSAARFVALAAVMRIAAAPAAAAPSQLVIEAPAALTGAAERVRALDEERLARALTTAGLEMPPVVHIALVSETDPRARLVPRWIVGRAFGDREVEIFPARVSVYPYDSIESVVRHEIVHLALDRRAGGQPVPRWFHEGVAEAIGSERGLFDRWELLHAVAGGPTLPGLAAQFESDRENETAGAYRLAVALVDDVRRRHGADAPGAIAARVAEGMPFARAFLSVTGESVEAAAAHAWDGYRRASQWLAVLSSGQVLWTGILLLACLALVARLRRRARLRRAWDELDGEG